MVPSRTVVIAGAGIGGLTAALALARRGFRVTVFEAAQQLEEIGAGIQLSPNAARILIGLGLESQLRSHVVEPDDIVVRLARTGETLALAPLGWSAADRFRAPYWVIHRGDLQATLLAAVAEVPEIKLHLGSKVEKFAILDGGVAVGAKFGLVSVGERGIAVIGADGLWSTVRRQLGHRAEPRFARHTAWRALIPAEAAPPGFTAPSLNLWLGAGSHLVHYPVKGGRMINVVAIRRDTWKEQGWNAPGQADDLLRLFDARHWHQPARDLLQASEHWQKWALFDHAPLKRWGSGPATLLGDAAHPMLPFLAQGGAMAIEDAAVLAACLGETPDDAAGALRRYEQQRLTRTARTQRASRQNGLLYHMGSAEPLLRLIARFAMNEDKLIRRYDWLYGWTPPD
jgi:salicylate hydroxylase